MAGISIKAELRDEDARGKLQALLDQMDNRQPLFAAIGERLVKSSSDNFQRQGGPDGKPWTPLKPSTIRKRTAAGQTPITILRSNSKGRSGSPLAGSVNYVATDSEVRVGSAKETAAIHQLGGTIQKAERAAKIYRMRGADGTIGRRFVKRKEANVVTDVTIPAHTITIPARPFIGVSAQDQVGILEDAEDWLMR